MVTLRFTREECEILKVAMIDYKDGGEAMKLPKNDPTEVKILWKIYEGLGEEFGADTGRLDSTPKPPVGSQVRSGKVEGE